MGEIRKMIKSELTEGKEGLGPLVVLGWPVVHSGFCKIVWKNLNKIFGQSQQI